MNKDFFVQKGTPFREAIALIEDSPYRIGFVVDESRHLFGALTSGDIYRAIFSGAVLDAAVETCCNRDPVFLTESECADSLAAKAKVKLLLERQGAWVPIVDDAGRVVEVRHVSELQEAARRKEDSAGPSKRVLVVGGAGYLGSVLSARLLEKGYAVRVLDTFAHRNFSIYGSAAPHGLEVVHGDIRDIRVVVSALEGVDAVVLLAAVVGDPASTRSPRETIEINYLAAKMIAEAAKYANINRFIFASTCSVYGMGDELLDEQSPLNPISLYARTKIAAEQAILSIGDTRFAPTIMRLSTLYGLSPRMRFDLVVNVFGLNAVTQGKIEVHGGTQWRPLVHVRDAADAFIAAIEAPLSKVGNHVFNVGSEEQNYQIATLASLVKEVYPETSVVVSETLEDARNYRVSFEKIRLALGFRPSVTIQQAIREIGEYVRPRIAEDFRTARYVNQSLEY